MKDGRTRQATSEGNTPPSFQIGGVIKQGSAMTFQKWIGNIIRHNLRAAGICMICSALLSAAAGTEYTAAMSRSGISIQRLVDLSLFSRVIAVEPPWGKFYLMTALLNETGVERIETPDGYKLLMQPEPAPTDFHLNEYSVEIRRDEVIVTFDGATVPGRPAEMEYSALMIPERLIRGASYTATQADGTARDGTIPEEWVLQARTLCEQLTKIVFHTKWGEYTVEVLDGFPLTMVDRRGFGFDVGYDTETPGIWIGSAFPLPEATGCRNVTAVRFDFKPALTFDESLAPTGSAEAIPVEQLISMPENLPARLPAVKEFTRISDERLPPVSYTLALPPEFAGADAGRLTRAAARLNDDSDAPAKTIAVHFSAQLKPEEYCLRNAPEAVEITAATPRGVFYALQTLNMYREDHCEIRDFPDMDLRSVLIMVDQNSLQVHGEIIEKLLAPLKINHLFIECEYAAWEALRDVRPEWAISKADLRRLIELANDNFIDVSPLFQTMGHSEYLFANGRNRELAEDDTLKVYNARHPGIRPLMTRVLDEVVEVFNHPEYLHIGHDEIGNEATYPQLPANRQIGGRKLIIEDVLFYYDYCRRNDLRMVLWNDMFVFTTPAGEAGSHFNLDEELAALPKDIIFAYWNYDDAIPAAAIEKLHAAGFELIGCTWYSPANNASMAQWIKRYHALGMMVTTWAGYQCTDRLLADHADQVAAYLFAAVYGWDNRPEAGRFSQTNELNLRLFPDWSDPAGPGTLWDLSPIANLSLAPDSHPFADEPDPGYFEHLAAPLGCAAAFQIAKRDGAPAVVALASSLHPAFPGSVEIALNRSARRLFFLHTIGRADVMLKTNQVVATAEIIYQDGGRQTVPIRFKKEIAGISDDYNVHLPKFRCVEWSDSTGEPVRNWYFVWENPRPEAEIASIRLTGDRRIPYYLLGLSSQ